MSECLEQFRSAVSGYMNEIGVVVDRSDIEDDIVLVAHGKVVQLRLLGDGNLLIATLVYLNMAGEDQYVDYAAISEFNSRHLFRGGYRLMVDSRLRSIHVEESVDMLSFDVGALSEMLYDFVKRSVTCTRWYIENLNSRDIITENYITAFA